MRRVNLLFACIALLPGCRAQYRVEIWNDTGYRAEVSIVERWNTVTHGDRRATVAPGGWFDYSLEDGDRWTRRALRVSVPELPADVELDLSETQVFRGRVLATPAGGLRIETMTPGQSEERRRAR